MEKKELKLYPLSPQLIDNHPWHCATYWEEYEEKTMGNSETEKLRPTSCQMIGNEWWSQYDTVVVWRVMLTF